MPSGSLAGTGWELHASTTAAVVPATQQEPIRWGELTRNQLTCQETQDVLTGNTHLLLEIVGANLWCDTSTGALRPLLPASQRRTVFEPSTGSTTLGGEPLGGWWLPALTGLAWQLMWCPGAKSVLCATGPR